MFVLKPLRQRPIALLWSGQVLSAVGDEVYKVALVWVAIGLVGTSAGYLAAIEAGSVLTFGLIGGIWADHWDHRRTMIWVDIVRGLTLLVVPLLALRGALTLWVLVPVAIVVSSLSAFFDPAMQETLPELAHGEVLHATNGLLEATRRLARILGPALVGILNGAVPLIHFFTIDAASFGVSALSIAKLGDSPTRSRPKPKPSTALRRVIDGLRAGFDLVRREPFMRYCIANASITWGMWSLVYMLGLALLLHERMPDRIGAYGLVIASYGCGNLTANLVFASFPIRRPGLVMFLGVLILGAGFVCVALAPSLPLMMIAASVSAVGGPMDDLSFLHVMQRLYRGRDIARIFRFRMAVAYASIFLCFLVSPWLFRHFPIERVLAASGAVIWVSGIVGLIRYGTYRAPEPAA